MLDPPVAEVAAMLAEPRRRFEAEGPTGLRCVAVSVDHSGPDHRGRLGFNAGLLPRVRTLLESLGYAVEVDD